MTPQERRKLVEKTALEMCSLFHSHVELHSDAWLRLARWHLRRVPAKDGRFNRRKVFRLSFGLSKKGGRTGEVPCCVTVKWREKGKK